MGSPEVTHSNALLIPFGSTNRGPTSWRSQLVILRTPCGTIRAVDQASISVRKIPMKNRMSQRRRLGTDALFTATKFVSCRMAGERAVPVLRLLDWQLFSLSTIQQWPESAFSMLFETVPYQ